VAVFGCSDYYQRLYGNEDYQDTNDLGIARIFMNIIFDIIFANYLEFLELRYLLRSAQVFLPRLSPIAILERTNSERVRMPGLRSFEIRCIHPF